jgi:RNA polymerase sigma-70 factor (ECF subfamily)
MVAADEQILIQKAQKQDPKAFRMLVESHQAFAYSLAFRFTNAEEEAEDLVQDAFVNVWKNLQRYNPEFRFKTWLGKIVTNLCLDYLKSTRRKFEAQRNDGNELDMIDPMPHDKKVEVAELNEIIMKLASQLTEKQQACFILRDLEMLSVEEVTAMIGLSSDNVKSNLYYARQKIRDGLLRVYGENIKHLTI